MIKNTKGDKGPGRWLHLFNFLVSIQWRYNVIRTMLSIINTSGEKTAILLSSSGVLTDLMQNADFTGILCTLVYVVPEGSFKKRYCSAIKLLMQQEVIKAKIVLRTKTFQVATVGYPDKRKYCPATIPLQQY